MRVSDLDRPEAALRLGYGLVPLVAGADKFTNLLCDWEQYLSPLAKRVLPIKGRTFMRLVGLVEIGVGALILTRWPRLGGYAASAWLGAISLNLLTCGDYYDVAARDALLAVGAFTLGRLSEGRAAISEGRRAPGLVSAGVRPVMTEAGERPAELH